MTRSREVVRTVNGKPLWITVQRKAESSEWTERRMLALAKARDNGAPSWLVRSKRTVRDIERLFRQREVAGILEHTVGGIVGGFGHTPSGHLKMQIDLSDARTAENVVLCLEELGVTIIEPA